MKIQPLPFEQAVVQGLISYPQNPFNDFIDSIQSRIRMDLLRERGPRILFDPMHGSGAYPDGVYTTRVHGGPHQL